MAFEDWPTNPQGWLLYPRDKPLRASLYPDDLLVRIASHPAKQLAYVTKDVIEEYTSPGQTILDPFGGIGTTLLAATMGRNVVLVEIEEYYQDIIADCISHLQTTGQAKGECLLIRKDNQLALPIPCDHIITSPPYGDDLAKAEGAHVLEQSYKGKDFRAYTAAPQNLGRLPKFVYQQAMKRVYAKMVDSVRPGGTITITHRDRMEGGQRVLYTDSIIGTLVRLGMRFEELHKWETPKTAQANANTKLGVETVGDEDVITMRKPL